jgi:flavorubredoxin/flavin reductase (DIM6/NTAB) family NADH-FMN oxidoreductase RutF
MYNVKQIKPDMFWVGGNDRRLALFESAFPVPEGMSYNAYLVLDEKTVLLDCVDRAVSGLFFENISFLLKDRPLDYVIINHVESDHAGTLQDLVSRYPAVKIVCTAAAMAMLQQFFTFDVTSHTIPVKDGEALATGRHSFRFFTAPMVHWPEVMVSYDETDHVLYSADAFGSFGAVNGNIFADELDFERRYLNEARRYYTNIVGKYGDQVQALLQKASGLALELVCPLHGPVWRKDIGWYLEKYQRWSTYTPEENAVMIAYASVYGNTENAASILASLLAERGVKNIAVYDVSVTDLSVIVAEAFRCSHLVFATTTYNAGIFVNMETLLHALEHHKLQNRTVSLIENGSWAPTAANLIKDILSSLKNITILEPVVSLLSSVKTAEHTQLTTLADTIVASIPQETLPAYNATAAAVDNTAFFKLSYGLFLLTAKEGDKDNGCIINTVMQITDTPKRISFTVNKHNFTHDMVMKTGIFTVSILSTETPFSLFQCFGFQSGLTVDKFAGIPEKKRGANGLIYDPRYANSFISGKVISTSDYGTHTLFVADVTEAAVLNLTPSLTYQYYFDHIKPKPPVAAAKKKGYICKICGYIHEAEELPPDFICPLCKHGAADFERL